MACLQASGVSTQIHATLCVSPIRASSKQGINAASSPCKKRPGSGTLDLLAAEAPLDKGMLHKNEEVQDYQPALLTLPLAFMS